MDAGKPSSVRLTWCRGLLKVPRRAGCLSVQGSPVGSASPMVGGNEVDLGDGGALMTEAAGDRPLVGPVLVG